VRNQSARGGDTALGGRRMSDVETLPDRLSTFGRTLAMLNPSRLAAIGPPAHTVEVQPPTGK